MIQNFNNTRKTFFCFSLFFALLIGLPAKMMAQSVGVPELQGSKASNLAPYTVEAESTTYTPLVGGITYYANSGGGIRGNENYTDIGFVFNMGCYDYDQFYINEYGMLSLGIKGVNALDFVVPHGSPGIPPPGAQANSPGAAFLAPFWSGDLSRTGGTVTYLTSGVEGSRVFTAEWKNWKWGSNSNTINFQVKIYEGTNTVEYIYNQGGAMSSGPGSPAAIGIYYGVYTATAKQLWLSDATASPGNSQTFSKTIATRPASGQVYRFLNHDEGLECTHYGQAVINLKGGVKPDATDGLRVFLSGTGQMQVRRLSRGMIGHSSLTTYDIVKGTTNPNYDNVSHEQAMVFSIGGTSFTGGNMNDADLVFFGNAPGINRLTMVSGTRQSFIQSKTNPDLYTNKIRMSATKNGLIYYFDVTYTYTNPDQKMRIDYSVVIPPGNTEKVKLLHGWNPFLDWTPTFDDTFWHRVQESVLKGTAPDLIMGVKAGRFYEAFEYISGIPWDSYYSGWGVPTGVQDPKAGFMTLSNHIAPPPANVHRIGITADFGSTPGTYTSSNYIVFACPAGDVKPDLPKSTVKPCKGTEFNLNDYLTPKVLEPGVVVKWYDSNLVEIADPTTVTAGGTYYVKYYSAKFDCDSPSATLTVTLDASCEVCVKPPVTTGTAAAFKTIISTLDRNISDRNWSDPITGSLILESKTKGFVLTRLASPETNIALPVEGMLIFDTAENVLKLYNGTIWKKLIQACPDN
ncbi:hypothetical protein [Flavobacterium chungangensis]|uniref:Ig-like domain-containing protein n=1 Tax=Flavobacterium chungangensis TaxID=2708132 RepID=A0ABV8ZBQ3_9FLAO